MFKKSYSRFLGFLSLLLRLFSVYGRLFADILLPGVSAGGRFLSGMICVLPICLPDGLIVCPLGATIVGIKALEYLKFIQGDNYHYR